MTRRPPVPPPREELERIARRLATDPEARALYNAIVLTDEEMLKLADEGGIPRSVALAALAERARRREPRGGGGGT